MAWLNAHKKLFFVRRIRQAEAQKTAIEIPRHRAKTQVLNELVNTKNKGDPLTGRLLNLTTEPDCIATYFALLAYIGKTF